jgi:hypothetical protein
MSKKQLLFSSLFFTVLFLVSLFVWIQISEGSIFSERKTTATIKEEQQFALMQSPSTESKTKTTTNLEANESEKTNTNQLSLLDQQPITGSEENFYAVMIDNSSPARPHHSSLDQARVVLEAPAEGGIPRIAAIFSSADNLERIGPVRSIRPYFIDLLAPLHPVVVHAGGSDEAMAMLRVSPNFADLDESIITTEMWRDQKIRRPHNLFTSSELIAGFAQNKDWQHGQSEPIFNFQESVFEGQKLTKITIDFGTQINDVTWVWDANLGQFSRQLYNENLEITADNLIIIETRQWNIPNDDKGRIAMTTTGSGKAIVARDGQCLEGTWQRADGEFLTLFDSEGREVSLKPGNTFIEVTRIGASSIK